MTDTNTVRDKITQITMGFKASRATNTLPASTSSPIFTISGGRVAIMLIVGEVTTIIQAQACNTKLVGTPTTGSNADLCATLDINAKEVGTLFGITGVFTDAMLGANAGGEQGPTKRPLCVLDLGTLNLSTSATNTGSVKWDIFFFPLDPGANIVAA